MLRQTSTQRLRIKTVTFLLGAYFSFLVAMLIFTGFFVYSNLSFTSDTVAATPATPATKTENKTITPPELQSEPVSPEKISAAANHRLQ